MSRRMNSGTAFAPARTGHPRADDRKNGFLYVLRLCVEGGAAEVLCNGMAEAKEVAGGSSPGSATP